MLYANDYYSLLTGPTILMPTTPTVTLSIILYDRQLVKTTSRNQAIRWLKATVENDFNIACNVKAVN